MPEFRIVTAIVRRGDDLLMVEQSKSGERPYWTVPGGAAEPGEFVTDAIVREVREETGLTVLDLGAPAFAAEVDDRRDGWFATVWTWDIARWEGELAADDPDGVVLNAAWVPVSEATARLELISWQPITARYLRGQLEPNSFWLRRVQEDAREELAGPF